MKAIRSASGLNKRPPSGAVSWSNYLGSLPESRRQQTLDLLVDQVAADEDVDRRDAWEILLYTWTFWARVEQLEPDGYYFVWFCLCGRGWGKTRTGAEAVRKWAEEGTELIALVAETPGDARDVMVLGPSGILAISPPSFCPKYEPTKRLLQWPRLRDDWIVRPGPQGHIYSGNNPDQLRGPQHEKAWVDELPKFPYARKVWENLLFGLRDADEPSICVTTTPKPISLVKEILARKSTVLVHGSSYDNRDNLSAVYYSEVIEPLEGTELAEQEIHARLLDEARGALWTREMIAKFRVDRIPEDVELVRGGVGVDPPISSKEGSAECGIVAAAMGDDGHCYVLADASARGRPATWAARAVATYDDLDPIFRDCLVYETNQGGEMVAHTLTGERAGLPLRSVHASKGKQARAQPVALKAEKGLIHFVGVFPELEDQLCTWVPGGDSPDRLDAFVWIVRYLMIGPQQVTRPLLPRMMRGEN